MTLRLRPLGLDDEAAARRAHAQLRTEEFSFLPWQQVEDTPWPEYVHLLAQHRRGLDLSVGQVRAAFLVADVDGELVGRISIRFGLNRFLSAFGGHIGYAVVPECRRCGYATEMLRQALTIGRSEGLRSMLVICNEDNAGSRCVIERNGGVFEGLAPSHDGTHQIRRYWLS